MKQLASVLWHRHDIRGIWVLRRGHTRPKDGVLNRRFSRGAMLVHAEPAVALPAEQCVSPRAGTAERLSQRAALLTIMLFCGEPVAV